jgi:hypothetical protein
VETAIRLHVGEVLLVIPARTHEVVYPELDYGEVVAGIPMMNKVQVALFPKPGEALKVSFGQVIMFVQVQMPAESREYADEVSDHYYCTGNEIDQCRDHDDWYAVVIQCVRLKIDELLGLQVVDVVFPVMSDGMCGKNLPNTVPVAKVLM